MLSFWRVLGLVISSRVGETLLVWHGESFLPSRGGLLHWHDSSMGKMHIKAWKTTLNPFIYPLDRLDRKEQNSFQIAELSNLLCFEFVVMAKLVIDDSLFPLINFID